MCSVDEDSESLMEYKESPNLVDSVCRKCSKKKAEVVLQGKFPYCRECFLGVVSHKFFAALGKTKVLRNTEKILLAFSGTQSSAALAHLVKEGLGEHRKKKLVSEVVVTYIDEGSVLGMDEEERLSVIDAVKTYLEQYDFKITFVNLTCRPSGISIYENSVSEMMTECLWDDSAVQKLFESVPSFSAKEDLLLKLRQNLLVQVAKKFSCSHIFTAETSDHLATNILSNLAMGRGGQLSMDVGFTDDRHEGVTIVRPLKDITKKEIAFYNRFNNITTVAVPSIGFMTTPSSSIQRLTEKFVTDLQESFPSTVSTIVSTGQKLSVSELMEDHGTCLLCKSKRDTCGNGLSALNARKFSHLLSSVGPGGFDSFTFTVVEKPQTPEETATCSNCNGISLFCPNAECSYKLPKVNVDDLSQCLCYGCQLIFKEAKSIESWPPVILYEIQKRSRMRKMKSEINDFLL